MIKILHIISALDAGGVEQMLFNYYDNIDKNKIHFDFIVHGDKVGVLEKPLTEMGSQIFHVTPKKVSFKANYYEIKKVIKNGNYDIVHVHQNYSSFPSLYAAWLCGVKRRIVHSHGYIAGDKIKGVKLIFRFLNNLLATDYFACSPEASVWLFGEEKAKHAFIMKNAIDIKKFKYDEEKRQIFRKKFDVTNEFVILQVGRFSPEKNHKFTIEVFSELKKDISEAMLIFVGTGDYEDEIKNFVLKKDLSDSVIFYGICDDVGGAMCAADLLIFPSTNEGFGMVAVEAQATGLRVLASDLVPKSTKISELIQYLPLSNQEKWLDEIVKEKEGLRKSSDLQEYSIDKLISQYLYIIKTIKE